MMGEAMVYGRYGTWPQKEWIVGKARNDGRSSGLWETLGMVEEVGIVGDVGHGGRRNGLWAMWELRGFTLHHNTRARAPALSSALATPPRPRHTLKVCPSHAPPTRAAAPASHQKDTPWLSPTSSRHLMQVDLGGVGEGIS